MPAASEFTPLFVESFVRRCYDAGLTKEATVTLLELSATKAAHEQPGFAAGFNEQMCEGGLDKSAWALAGKLLTGGLVGGGVGYGGYKAYDAFRNHNRETLGGVPTIAGYDANRDASRNRLDLSEASRGIGEMNKTVGANGRRRAELERALAGGTGGGAARAELERLSADPITRQREQYGRQLDDFTRDAQGMRDTAQEDARNLQQTRNSWWGRTRQFFGHDYGPRARQLDDQTKRMTEQSQLSSRLRDRLRSGATGFDDRAPTPPETMKSRFFSTD